MATFQVPQFIEEKPKIVGFLTLPQFLYLAAAGGIIIGMFYTFTFIVAIFFSVIVGGLGVGLAFIKINGQSFPMIVLNALKYVWSPRRYTWQRSTAQTSLDISKLEKLEAIRSRIHLEDKLKSIALGISTGKLFTANELRNAGTATEERKETVTYLTGEKRLAKRVDYK